MEQRGDDPRYRVEGGHEVPAFDDDDRQKIRAVANRQLVDELPGMREEADTAGGLTDAEAMVHDQSEFPYTVALVQLDNETPGILLTDDNAELDFQVEPQYVPELVARLVEKHQQWLQAEATKASKARHPSNQPDNRFAAAKAAGMLVTDADLERERLQNEFPKGGATPL